MSSNKRQRIEKTTKANRQRIADAQGLQQRSLQLVPYPAAPPAPAPIAAGAYYFPGAPPYPSMGAFPPVVPQQPYYPGMYSTFMGMQQPVYYPQQPGVNHSFAPPQQPSVNYSFVPPHSHHFQAPIVINNNTTNYNVNADTINANTYNADAPVSIQNTLNSHSQSRSSPVQPSGKESDGNTKNTTGLEDVDESEDGENVPAVEVLDSEDAVAVVEERDALAAEGTDGGDALAAEGTHPAAINDAEEVEQITMLNVSEECGDTAGDVERQDNGNHKSWSCPGCTLMNYGLSLSCRVCNTHWNATGPNPDAVAAFDPIALAAPEGDDDVIVLDSENSALRRADGGSNNVTSTNDDSENVEECGICLHPLSLYPEHETKCCHKFHEACFHKVLEKCDFCPLCRTKL